jgi:hypothetical protein
MNPSNSSPRRRRNLSLGAEALESRELLTGGAGNTFAIIPGTVSTANGTTAINFTIDPTLFHLPKRAFTMGIDVIPASGSTINPLISSVFGHGDTQIIPQTFHSVYNPHLTYQQLSAGDGPSSVLTPLQLGHGVNANSPITYTVHVTAFNNTSGNFLLGFYLPGDVNGDGTVNKADLAIVKSLQNVTKDSPNYNFEADANRDGRIGKIDTSFTLQNQGVSVSVSPVVTANVNPADVNSAGLALTNPIQYTGTATPGAKITFTNSISGVPATTTTADSTGNYSINVPLGNGVNTFTVSSSDPFGQVITGQIAPVDFSTVPPAQPTKATK